MGRRCWLHSWRKKSTLSRILHKSHGKMENQKNPPWIHSCQHNGRVGRYVFMYQDKGQYYPTMFFLEVFLPWIPKHLLQLLWINCLWPSGPTNKFLESIGYSCENSSMTKAIQRVAKPKEIFTSSKTIWKSRKTFITHSRKEVVLLCIKVWPRGEWSLFGIVWLKKWRDTTLKPKNEKVILPSAKET